MDYSRNDIEGIVLGTILNDSGDDGFMRSCRMSLRRELFRDKRNAFIFGILDMMYMEGITSTTPYDVVVYAESKGIKYGNLQEFLLYMCGLTKNYAYMGFKRYVRELVTMYIRDRKLYG